MLKDNNRFTIGIHPSDPFVRGRCLHNFQHFTVDRNRTVSRRSKPSSRTTFIGEQPNPWNLVLLQDVMSRHRGAKRSRRWELSRTISLLSLTYLLSVKQQPSHLELLDHYGQLSFLLDSFILQLSKLMPLTLPLIKHQFEFAFAHLRYPFGDDRPSQTNTVEMYTLLLVHGF